MTKRAKKAKKPSIEKQHARFVEAATQAEADKRPDAMDRAFKALNIRQKAEDKSHT